MKMKTWHLFLVIIILFGCSFYVVNLNFDKFYRVNGINNDNRVLIEKYLDEDEQTYLVENQIPIDQFIEYIKKDEFHLQNYEYYNGLKNSNRYSDNLDKILEMGNNLATRLSYLFRDGAYLHFKMLIDSSLENAFLSQESFNFDYFDLYNYIKVLYQSTDYSFIADTQVYVEKLKSIGYTDSDNLKNGFKQMSQAYTKESLKEFLTIQLPEKTNHVLNPNDLSTLVNETHYIGKYEPTGLILTQDIPRIRYAMYLQGDAYIALTRMYEEITKSHSGFLLMEAYQSPLVLSSQEIGYTESQLGLTIEVSQTQTKYDDFKNTNLSKWLESHAYEYGYVLRYPNNKASITNRTYDPHIYRYVGIELAKTLHDSQITLEEYYANQR